MTRDAVLSVHAAAVTVVAAATIYGAEDDWAVLAVESALADVPAGMESWLATRIGDMEDVAARFGLPGLRHAGMAGALARCGLTA